MTGWLSADDGEDDEDDERNDDKDSCQQSNRCHGEHREDMGTSTRANQALSH